ncbi:MAG: transglutaminase family protein [Hyphomicrobiales bacterium]|nr:transglutaminase family protein [Hyphomicrobiales bacterium]
MIYDIRHVTSYSYESPVSSAVCTLRLSPREGRGQHVADSGIEIAPNPASRTQRTDFFGNLVTTIVIEEAHRELRVASLSRVEVRREPQPHAELTPGWEDIREQASMIRALDYRSPAHDIFPTRLVPLYEPATDYAAKSFSPGRPILSGALELMRRIRDEFRYDPKATLISTPLSEAFESRGGVCQDFAHIMIAGLRGLGLPACYVSGYIRTIPPEGQPRLEGADASHAWVRVWCGESIGWLGLDPTNALQVNDDFVEVAVGRDYSDVAPLDGIILIAGKQKLKVSVDVKPVG